MKIECPKCGKSKEIPYDPTYDPPQAVLQKIHCDECHDGSWDNGHFYDESGKEIEP